MNAAADELRAILAVLLEEEQGLLRLNALALAEQRALVCSDYEEIERVSNEMQVVADQIESGELRRARMMGAVGKPEATLSEILPLADLHGVDGLREASKRMILLAGQLREAQEGNARLLLSAVKLRERWVNHVAGMHASTYGAEGKQQIRQSRGIVSRSA